MNTFFRFKQIFEEEKYIQTQIKMRQMIQQQQKTVNKINNEQK